VPAFRPSASKWNFGRVVAYSRPFFAVFFDDVDGGGNGGVRPEWIDLDPKPMDSYLRSRALAPPPASNSWTRPERPHRSAQGEAPIRRSSEPDPLGWWTRGAAPPPLSPPHYPEQQHPGWPRSPPPSAASRALLLGPVPAHDPGTRVGSDERSEDDQIGDEEHEDGNERDGDGDRDSPATELDLGVANKLVHKSSPRMWTTEVSQGGRYEREAPTNDQDAFSHSLSDLPSFDGDGGTGARQEDRLLIQAVQTFHGTPASYLNGTIKWPDVAKLVPRRTGKQCRERYFNHLASTVAAKAWTPVEDSAVCRLYGQVGSRWAFISKFLPGRSDNNVKNRFHYLRRQLEKQEVAPTLDGVDSTDLSDSSSRKHQILFCVRATVRVSDDLACTISDLIMHMLNTDQRLLSPYDIYPGFFGPFEAPRSLQASFCNRCGLAVPAAQTGMEICSKTGWCVECSKAMVFLSDSALRLEHKLRSYAAPDGSTAPGDTEEY
jgi:hypothetical protein